jgi:hypothetical protein
MSQMTTDQIRTALAAAGARRQRTIRAELEARAEIVELLRQGLGTFVALLMLPGSKPCMRPRLFPLLARHCHIASECHTVSKR